MSNRPFDFGHRVSEHDQCIASTYIGSLYRPPDEVIAPPGCEEYLYRWYVVPKNRSANVYFHVQTQSDPERPLHDHGWDNTSVILAGGYNEIINTDPKEREQNCTYQIARKVGDVIHRPATWAHRLIMPSSRGISYTMSLFLTGPKVRNWGFWYEGAFTQFDGDMQ